MADDLHERIREGTKVMAQEQAKNYRHLEEVPFIFSFMFCCGRSGPCVRARLTVLNEHSGAFSTTDFMRANIIRVDDKWFLDRIKKEPTKLHGLFQLLNFYDPTIADDFALMSKNLSIGRESDVFVDRFVRGKELKCLYDHCVRVVGSIPTNEDIVELTFSAEKTIHRANETRQQTSQERQYQQNVVALLRTERSQMSAGSKNKGNHSTLAQVNKAGEQMIKLMAGYRPSRMAELAGRRTHQGALKGADVAQAEAAVDMKLDERAKQTARKAPSTEILRERELKHGSALKKHEKELAVIVEVTAEDRHRAVVSEVKFKGQVGSAANFFNVDHNAEKQRELLQAALPLCFGFALAVTDPAKVSLWWRTGGLSSQGLHEGRGLVRCTDPEVARRSQHKQAYAALVLKMVREVRGALLRSLSPFLSVREQHMIGVMRLGVLRMTPGITEVDAAVRDRTTKPK